MKRIIEDRLDCELELPEGIGHRAHVVYALAGQALARGLDIAECGVAQGQTAARLAQMAHAVNHAERAPLKKAVLVYLFDVFDAAKLVARNQMAADAVAKRHATPLADVTSLITANHRDSERYVRYYPGLFRETLPKFDAADFGFIHADADLRDSTEDIIELANRRMHTGGVVLFDDWLTEWSGVADAVNAKLGPDWWTYSVKGSGQLVAVRR